MEKVGSYKTYVNLKWDGLSRVTFKGVTDLLEEKIYLGIISSVTVRHIWLKHWVVVGVVAWGTIKVHN